jgi:hypothetical protein
VSINIIKKIMVQILEKLKYKKQYKVILMRSDQKRKKSSVFFCKETTSIKEEARTVGFQLTSIRTQSPDSIPISFF